MKSLISALVLTAASVLPVSAGLHDFNPTNAAPVPTQQKARVGQGQCINTRDGSQICYLKTSPSNFSIAIRDVDYPNSTEVAHIDCSTGRWGAFGDLPKATLELYLEDFCPTFG
tara:strand:+ start:857 stop:1198 length:342 start_codon:yes stop_codon:yes gene_type:complete